MGYNFVNNEALVSLSEECKYDTNEAYSADFSVNGDVDGWDTYVGIHTYGTWAGFLFGTLFAQDAYIGRTSPFIPVAAEHYYTVKIVMKINPINATGNTQVPTTAKLQWRTLTNSSWDSDKETEFDIEADNKWRAYYIQMADEYYWQGDVNDLRVYPATDSIPDNEFFIKQIKIQSVAQFRCDNSSCSFYSQYSHPCQGVGSKTTCTSVVNEENVYTIDSTNDYIIMNINDYGEEIVEISEGTYTGQELAKEMATEISKLAIGGYAEITIQYDDDGRFIIYNGVKGDDGTIEVKYSKLSEDLGLFNTEEDSVYTIEAGEYPATGFLPKSSLNLSTFQLLGLFDNKENTSFEFDPSLRSVQGGRAGWFTTGLGETTITEGTPNSQRYGPTDRDYDIIYNRNKTLVDFTHPFNSSGKIHKISVAGTYDTGDEDGGGDPIYATNCKILLLRPTKDGSLRRVDSINIPNRSTSGSILWSNNTEAIELDCDWWVNKGDLLGIYNFSVYAGKTIFDSEPDATYFQISGLPASLIEFDPGPIKGNGNAGILVFARSDNLQTALVFDVDLTKRVNIKDVIIDGESKTTELEYNIARCLDISWNVDLFGGTHKAGYYDTLLSAYQEFTITDVAYGVDLLDDGVKIVDRGLASDTFSVTDAGGVVPDNPTYFHVNGDGEWVGIHHLVGTYRSEQYVKDFKEDPIAIYTIFPNDSSKNVYKSVIYFKEKWNFRNLALSYYLNEYDTSGDADDSHYRLVSDYTAITLDDVRYTSVTPGYDNISAYIFQNPTNAYPEKVTTWVNEDPTVPVVERGYISNYEEYMQQQVVDWLTIKHEFDEVFCRGFRIYSDYHMSTKITEIELYCRADDLEASLAAGISMSYSHYEELWWPVDIEDETNAQATGQIDDTPRYMNVQVEPITTIELSNVLFTVNSEDVYSGEKGCEYEIVPANNKINAVNEAEIFYLKNVYDRPFNLYVDIAKDPGKNESLVFFSKLDSYDSITNPEVGPGAQLSKGDEDYLLYHQNNVCSINCPTYGLKNLIDEKQSYYSEDSGYTWTSYGELSHGESIDLSNLETGNMTTAYINVTYRERYWRFSLTSVSPDVDINEFRIYDENDNEIFGTWYHDQGISLELDPATDTAPHINNGSVKGSYYTLTSDDYITVDLGSLKAIHKVVFWNQDPGSYTYATLSVYSSPDNNVYSKHSDIDMLVTPNIFNGESYTYLAIDFEKRYALEIVRSYGSSDAHDVSPIANLDLSDDDISNVNLVDFDVEAELEWTEKEYSIVNDTYFADKAMILPGTKIDKDIGDFIVIYLDTDAHLDSNDFTIDVWVRMDILTGTQTFICHGYPQGTGRWRFYFDGTGFHANMINFSIDGGLSGWDIDTWYHVALVRNGSSVKLYRDGIEINSTSFGGSIPLIADPHYTDLDHISPFFVGVDHYNSFFGGGGGWAWYNITNLLTGAVSKARILNGVALWTSNFTPPVREIHWEVLPNTAVHMDAVTDMTDARWVRAKMLNGDGESRIIRKLGIYTDIHVYPAPGGGNNTEWDSLGTAVTTFLGEDNSALYATVSGSSSFYGMSPDKVTDGNTDGGFFNVWGSDTDSTQWFSISLGASKDIYKFDMYFGLDEDDTDYMVHDYTVQTSSDGTNYTTRFTITNNTSNYRTHTLASPVQAKYVKINVTDYSSMSVTLGTGESGYEIFAGAVVREVQVFEDYGREEISSEEYPVICTNLNYQFYISDVDIDGRGDGSEWTRAFYSYSDFITSNPEDVRFDGWRNAPVYEQWVAIKNNTATNYGEGPDYLKTIYAQSVDQKAPCDHSKWWASTLSTLDEEHVMVKKFSTNSIKISYPASNQSEHIYYYEGDTFGTDEAASWRDGFSFFWYIDDIENLDLTHGYIYFGGYDYTEAANPITYQWNLSDVTVSGALTSGWNGLFLRFNQANEIEYTEGVVATGRTPNYDDIRIPRTVAMRTIGLVFRGKGNAITMYINGFGIVRNVFEDPMPNGQGLYLTHEDYIGTHLGELEMSKGTIEFFFKSDYDWQGKSYYNEFRHRPLFHITNSANDVFGASFSYNGLEIYYGNADDKLYFLGVTNLTYIDIDIVSHFAIVFSNNGEHIDSDGSTIRVYVNNVLMAKSTQTWDLLDNKYFKFLLGGKGLLALKENTYSTDTYSMSAVVSDLKIYNYCKLDFSDSIGGAEVERADLIKPSELIEISKDNLTFYKVGDNNLPLLYDFVPVGDSVPVYVRTSLPKGLTGKEQRTAALVAEWDITV